MIPKFLTTAEAAALARVRQTTLREAVCRNGHWCGVRPTKLPNRRLRWPIDAVESVLRGEPLPAEPITK